MAALDPGRYVAPLFPPFVGGGPAFGHQQMRLRRRQIEHISDVMTNQINIVDPLGALARQSNLHPAY